MSNGIKGVIVVEKYEKIIIGAWLYRLYSALNFTDSRSVYQFYNLGRLWNDIQTVLREDIKLWHPATEPVSAAEIYKYLSGEEFVNELGGTPANYDYKTVHAEIFGGKNGYICDKGQILSEIKEFVGA